MDATTPTPEREDRPTNIADRTREGSF